MNPETDIICLEIVKGIPKAPGDPHSTEQDLETLNLLDPNGFGVQPDGWTMGLPGLKRSGVWVDSQLSDGRSLIAAAKDNVTETLTLAIGNQDLLQRYQLFTKLQRLAEDARAFWTADYQIEPVYLKFKANGARVFQYALIYDLTIADTSDPYEVAEAIEVTLVIEREPAWRMVVPPGGNPVEYWLWAQGKIPGVDYNYEQVGLASLNSFHYETIYNAAEWDATAYAGFSFRNWIDIDANKLPGDAPALVFLDCYTDTRNGRSAGEVHVAKTTVSRTQNDHDGDLFYLHHILNCGDADAASAITKAVDTCGVYSNGSNVNRYIGTYTAASGANWIANVCYWWQCLGTGTRLNLTSWRGEFIAFLRCNQLTGALGDVETRLKITLMRYTELIGPRVIMPFLTIGADCLNEFGLAYLGRFKIPFDTDTDTWFYDGRGISVIDKSAMQSNIKFEIQLFNDCGSSRNVQMLDLILLPINEGCLSMTTPISRQTSEYQESSHIYYDNTGYVAHGHIDGVARHAIIEISDTQWHDAIGYTGQDLMLTPHKDNRLEFLFQEAESGVLSSPAYQELRIRLNIVPRCYGVADV